MATMTKIQWTDHTWNPWRGCTKVSPGCHHCYAETQSKRNPRVLGEWGPKGRRAIAADPYWRLPLQWDRAAKEAGERRRVFCASLADVFEHNDQVAEARARLFRTIDSTPNLDWLLLTKRPENIGMMWHTWSQYDDRGEPLGESKPTRREIRRHNVWLGTSVEDQDRANERIPELLGCRDLAEVLFLSLEPLVGRVSLIGVAGWTDPGRFFGRRPGEGIDWAIVGGESGPGARPCNTYWIREIVRDCVDAGVTPFVKQLGASPFDDSTGGNRYDDHTYFRLRDSKGGDPDEWPEDLRVREFPR